MYFCIKILHRDPGWSLYSERPLNPSSVYYWPFEGSGPDVVILCSSAVYEALHVWSCPTLCLSVSSVLLAFWSPLLEKREQVFVSIVHLFVSYAHVNLCNFFSSSWCRGWLQLLLGALSGLFCYLFLYSGIFRIKVFNCGTRVYFTCQCVLKVWVQ